MGGGECVVHRGWAVSGQEAWLKERAAKGAWRGRRRKGKSAKADVAGENKNKHRDLVDAITKPCLFFGPNKRTDA